MSCRKGRDGAQLLAPNHTSGQAECWDTALNRAGETAEVRPPISNLVTHRAAAPAEQPAAITAAQVLQTPGLSQRGYPVFIKQPYDLGHKSIS